MSWACGGACVEFFCSSCVLLSCAKHALDWLNHASAISAAVRQKELVVFIALPRKSFQEHHISLRIVSDARCGSATCLRGRRFAVDVHCVPGVLRTAKNTL